MLLMFHQDSHGKNLLQQIRWYCVQGVSPLPHMHILWAKYFKNTFTYWGPSEPKCIKLDWLELLQQSPVWSYDIHLQLALLASTFFDQPAIIQSLPYNAISIYSNILTINLPLTLIVGCSWYFTFNKLNTNLQQFIIANQWYISPACFKLHKLYRFYCVTRLVFSLACVLAEEQQPL